MIVVGLKKEKNTKIEGSKVKFDQIAQRYPFLANSISD
jgi:hypothetical protein